MKFQFVTQLSNIENKATDIIICNLKNEKVKLNEDIIASNIIQYLISTSLNLQCLIFAYITCVYETTETKSVAIISNGTLIDIYEEKDIETKFNLISYDTRIGKVAILVESDIYNKNIIYAYEAKNTDLLLVFLNEYNKIDFYSLNCNLPYILIANEEIFTSK